MSNIVKFLSTFVVVGTLALTGCNSAKVAKINADVNTLNEKVEVLAKDVKNLQDDAKVAKYDADRANKRLDNQVTTYRK